MYGHNIEWKISKPLADLILKSCPPQWKVPNTGIKESRVSVKDGCGYEFRVTVDANGDKMTALYCCVDFFPANCGMVILNNFSVTGSLTKKGIGKAFLNSVMHNIQQCGYSYVIGSCNPGNETFLEMAKKMGWKELSEFENIRSENTIQVIGFEF